MSCVSAQKFVHIADKKYIQLGIDEIFVLTSKGIKAARRSTNKFLRAYLADPLAFGLLMKRLPKASKEPQGFGSGCHMPSQNSFLSPILSGVI